jgi:hypothetical protein
MVAPTADGGEAGDPDSVTDNSLLALPGHRNTTIPA